MLPDAQDERGGVAEHEHLESGIPGALGCGDAHGVGGQFTLAVLPASGGGWCSW